MKNKTILSLILVMTLFMSSTKVGAQRTEFGIRFMPTFSSLNVKTSSGGSLSGDVTLGYGIGALLGFNFSNHVGIQGEVIYNSISQKYKELNDDRKVNLRYVNIPLLLSLNTSKNSAVNLNVVAGPQIGVSVGSHLSGFNSSTDSPVLSVKKGDLGFAYGAGLDFGINNSRTTRFGIGYRGVSGLLDISDNNGTINTESYYLLDKTHIRTNSIYVGLSFLF